jgi:hypothetical protein
MNESGKRQMIDRLPLSLVFRIKLSAASSRHCRRKETAGNETNFAGRKLFDPIFFQARGAIPERTTLGAMKQPFN